MTGDRVRAVVTCDRCTWSAEHTGDDGVEVAGFLRRLLLTHFLMNHERDPNVLRFREALNADKQKADR